MIFTANMRGVSEGLMDYHSLVVSGISEGIYSIQLNRAAEKNSITSALIEDLQHVLLWLDGLDSCKAIVLEGSAGYFCTGMNFQAFTEDGAEGEDHTAPAPEAFMRTMKLIGEISKVVIAKVDGQVMAGGIGLMAACDYVFASPRSSFALPEAIWGLIPAMVTPYLIRRTGYWQAYKMTLTTLPLSAEEALQHHLVDEVVSDLDGGILRLYKRISRVSPNTVKEIKSYFKKMWIINETMENAAVQEIDKLTSSTEVREAIQNYVQYKRFPWEKG
ncbi:enoyl-CoA hydratase-related protein [Paenibacillus sp. BR2-3]|uniref:enoyl-CoA hydratase-related protein n=1 Tax=Paenibacillus sp. BR2-3 TaxID=3048494 RepID=UPI0039776B91